MHTRKIEVQAVKRHRHLGCVQTDSGNLAPEIVARDCALRTELRTSRKIALADPGVQFATRVKLTDILLINAFARASCTWVLDTAQQKQKFHNAVMYANRVALRALPRSQEDRGVPHSGVLHCIERLPPSALLTVARLRYFPRLLRHAPIPYLASLQAAGSEAGTWTRELTGDLEWLSAHTTIFAELQPPGDDLVPWQTFAQNWPRQWKRAIAKAGQAAVHAQERESSKCAERAKLLAPAKAQVTTPLFTHGTQTAEMIETAPTGPAPQNTKKHKTT